MYSMYPKVGIKAATGSVLYKIVFLKISQHSQENTCARKNVFKKS